MKITKEAVLEGYSHRIEVSAPEYGEAAVFVVSSPLASEVSEAKALRMKLSEVKSEVDPSEIDLRKALVAEEYVRRFLVSKALTKGMGEEWTVEDVEKIKPSVLSRLWDAVDGLIGFTGEGEESVRNFPKAQLDKS